MHKCTYMFMHFYTCINSDLATSGLVVFAKNAPACARINGAFSERQVTKIYKALIWGTCVCLCQCVGACVYVWLNAALREQQLTNLYMA